MQKSSNNHLFRWKVIISQISAAPGKLLYFLVWWHKLSQISAEQKCLRTIFTYSKAHTLPRIGFETEFLTERVVVGEGENRGGRKSSLGGNGKWFVLGRARVEQGLTSHQTHRSYRARVFTGRMIQPTVSKHWRIISYSTEGRIDVRE